MRKRDKAIVESLKQFRVLDRDQLIELHFNNLKNRVAGCNLVMKRLTRDGLVVVDRERRPFHYFPNPAPINPKSPKLNHFKAIADTVIEAKQLGRIREYEVEIKLGKKGTVEPDLFLLWERVPMFVEVQTSYIQKSSYMEKKLKKYENYYNSGDWERLSWQPSKPVFPCVLIISNHSYSLTKTPFPVFQVKSFTEFINKYIHRKKDS